MIFIFKEHGIHVLKAVLVKSHLEFTLCFDEGVEFQLHRNRHLLASIDVRIRVVNRKLNLLLTRVCRVDHFGLKKVVGWLAEGAERISWVDIDF